MELGSFHGGEYDEHTGVGVVEISVIYLRSWTIFFSGTLSFDRVYTSRSLSTYLPLHLYGSEAGSGADGVRSQGPSR